MNGNGRLYRSTSDGMIGGVAAGIGSYFKIDPTLVRAGFLVLMLLTSGAFLFVYLAMWLLIPTAASTATDANQVIQENLNDMGARVRGFTRPNSGSAGASAQANGGATPNGGQAAAPQGQAQLPQAGSTARHGANPTILIAIGAFFLLANLGFFRGFHWGIWWPLLLIGLGAILLTRRERA